MIGLDRHPVRRLHDRHGRVRGEQLDHVALAGGVEVRDEHERQAIVRRHRVQERAERLEAPGGGADAHDDRPGRAAVGRGVGGLRGGPLRDGVLRPRRGRSSSCLRSFRGPLRSHRHLSSALEETLLPSIPERHRRGYGQRLPPGWGEGVLPWHRRSSYEPDGPARGVPQSPRWRVGLVCRKDAKLSCRGNIRWDRGPWKLHAVGRQEGDRGDAGVVRIIPSTRVGTSLTQSVESPGHTNQRRVR